MTTPAKKIKKKGFIRWEAVLPFFIVVGLTWAYFFFFFDLHLRKALELGGYQALGAEVNVHDVSTSFWKASLRIRGVQLTDPEKPSQNMLEIGDIRFGMLWDGLLRAKVVINEMAVEGIKAGTPRRSAGRVKPPEPEAKEDGPSKLEQEGERLKNKVLDSTKEQHGNNVLGDIAALLSGTSGDDQLKNIEGSLVFKKQMDEMNKLYAEKSKVWEERFKTLPKPKEIQELGDRMGKIKTKDFKTPQELADSIKQFEAITKEADAKYKVLESAGQDLGADTKALDQGMKELDALIKKDVKDLEARFRIPKLDAKEISKSLFAQYLNPYLARFEQYRLLAQTYLPPKIMKKGEKEPDPQIQPMPRKKGVSYEFGRPNSYPLFWAKRISVTSQAGSEAGAGNIEGLITDVTSNQVLTGKPTLARFKGDFPNDQIFGLLAEVSLDSRKERSEVDFKFEIGGYPISGRPVVDSPEVKLGFQNAMGSISTSGKLIGFKDIQFELANKVKKVSYEIEAKNSTVEEVLKAIFVGIPEVSINASVNGTLPSVAIDVNSNLGPEIQKGFAAQLQKKIDEAKQKVQAAIDQLIGKEKSKLEGEVNKFKSQGDVEVKKLQDQVNGQKNQAQAKIDESKKKFEDQATQGLKKETDKAVEDLKKKLGW